MALTEKPVTDRRIQKTHNLLREALHSLIREKDYDSIAVKEILDRANVGRSTFYMHFRDKDELLVRSIYEMLQPVQSKQQPRSARPYDNIIWFSLPVFEYHHQHRQTGEARMGTRGRAVIHEHLQSVIAKLISSGVKKALQGRRSTAREVPADLLTQYIASTFILVLNWWTESRNPLPPEKIDELFRSLVLPTLTTICS